MYCPWDVMSFCNENYLQAGEDGAVVTAENYWINTSGNDVIEEFMGYLKSEDTDMMQKLLDGESIITPVSASLCYGDLIKHDITDFWTLLLYTGYLTFDPRYRSETKGEYRLYIPNEEIRECFKTKIMDFFSSNQKMKEYTEGFVKGLFIGDSEMVENSLNELLSKYVSVRDFSTKAPKENYYHGFVNGLLVNGASLIKEQKSNFESGNGYVDLIIKSKGTTGNIVIMELKQTSDEEVDKGKMAVEAVDQIIRKKYADAYISRTDIKAVLIYGICFCKKECSVAGKKLK
jgi:Holliday junction resolvase-like predicted endonuclease